MESEMPDRPKDVSTQEVDGRPLNTQEPKAALHDWRSGVLNTLLPLAAIAIFPSLFQTVRQIFLRPQEIAWQGVAIFIFLYLVLIYITVNRGLSSGKRSWGIILLTYFAGVVSMARGGLAGDGTIYLTVLPILTITLVNIRTGLYAVGVSLSTFAVFSILANSGMLDQSLIIHDNPLTFDQWIYFGLTMTTLILVTVFVVARFARFQLTTLESVQKVSQALLDANKLLEEKVQQRTNELSSANRNLQFLATHDNLTGLPNRALFFDRLEQMIRSSRRAKKRFALFFIDLDDFKRINDTYGHLVGDQVLKDVSGFLSHAVRDSDTVARLAGDEFTIILENVQAVENVEAIARKTLAAVSQPMEIKSETIIMTISIGVSIFPEHGDDAETLLKKADAAMYQIKEGSKNDYYIHVE
jgi:diguanylate cyclase (GGDEF)-like protein